MMKNWKRHDNLRNLQAQHIQTSQLPPPYLVRSISLLASGALCGLETEMIGEALLQGLPAALPGVAFLLGFLGMWVYQEIKDRRKK